jgi:GTP-binding protein TypA/BipA
VVNEVFDLFVELGADDETLDFPIIYASGRAGIASWKAEERGTDIKPVFEAILKHIPAPHGDPDKSLQVRITSIQYNDYVGRIGVGRIYNGVIKSGQQVSVAKRDGSIVKSKMQQLQVFDGFGRKNADDAAAGDIVALIGLDSVDIGDTICDFLDPHPLDPTEVEPPTLVMMFSVNDSPFAGREGKYVTSRNLRERLFKELESNVALKVEETEAKDAFKVSGRGLLHLGHPDREHAPRGVRAEHLQAAGDHAEEQGDRRVEEPIEYLVVDVPEKSMGGVMELVGNRKGELVRMDNREGQVHLEFTIPARGLIGLRTRMLTATQGTAIMHHNFHEYARGPRRRPGPGERRDDQHGQRERERVRPEQPPAARRDVRRADAGGVRGDDRGRERPGQRHAGEPDDGQEAVEHADDEQRREHHPQAGEEDDARAGAGVHRGRRAGRGDAAEHPAAEAAADRERPQEGRPQPADGDGGGVRRPGAPPNGGGADRR